MMGGRLGRNDICWCGSGQKYKRCHEDIDQRIKSFKDNGRIVPGRSLIKSKHQIDMIRESCRVNIAILDFISNYISEGISTGELDQLVYNKTKEIGGIPATLNYNGYPKSMCVSVNDQVCHGIPSDNVILKDGDILNVDISTKYNGYFSDSSRMFMVGKVSDDKARLVKVTKECVELGIQQIQPWGFLGDVGHVIYSHARKNGYSVVKEIGGHGIGLKFHEDPWVSYTASKGTGMILVPGMIFTIEPMINMGTAEVFTDLKDGFTVYTIDNKPSAQWESMVLVTDSGCEVLCY